MGALSVLLWKDLMISKRKIISVIYQMVFPVLFTLVTVYFRSRTEPAASSVKIKLKEDKYLDDRTTSPSCILYTPNSNVTGILMQEVGKTLGLPRLTTLPHKSPCNGYYPYSNYSEIAELVKTFNDNEALIIFENMDAEHWHSRPEDRLTYTIRMDNKFDTHSVTSTNAKFPADHPAYGDIYDDFMRIQWAIDTSYIKVRSGKKVPQKLSLQEFPHFRDGADQEKLMNSLVRGIIYFFIMVVSAINIFMNIMTRMLSERAAGIQELIKMNGVSSTTLGIAYFISSLPPALSLSIGCSIFMQIGKRPMIAYTSGLYTFIGLALYAVSLIAFGMACSYLINQPRFATAISMFIYIGTVVVIKYVMQYAPETRTLTLMSGMLWHVPLSWIFAEIFYFEAHQKPLTMSDLNHKMPSKGSVLEAYVCLTLQSLIYFAITWYLSHVRQGKYGNSLPWNFLFKKKVDENALISAYQEAPEERDNRYFEEPPKNKEVGIKIINVSKYYPKPALNDVSLDVYKGEITILLGHNGAGKTTLMSIITGMTAASQGKVLVHGLETGAHSLRVRKEIGLCPQHNLFIDHINVIEHVMFFNMLKGKSKNPRATSQELLNKLGIGVKESANPSELSGGMKRRLQLACALAGGSDVLVLDEPTSGLDIETRRELWDLLLSLRGERTVLLSTHFMEEADALGDRVAALHTGQLRCHATPMYLKKAMGGGYRLSLVTSGKPRQEEITPVVTKHVAGASVREELMNTLTYNLPSAAAPQFPSLFAALEHNRSALEIDSIGVGVSTMEEVFLYLCSDSETFIKEEADTEVPASEYGKVKGKVLYKRQAIVLFKRQLNFLRESFISFPVLSEALVTCNTGSLNLHQAPVFTIQHILVPGLLIYFFAMTSNTKKEPDATPDRSIRMDLDIYKPLPERRAFMNVNATSASMRAKDQYKNVKFARSGNISNDLFQIGKGDILEYNKYLVGVELDDEHAKALYTTVYRHAAPVALNLLSNILASQYLPAAGARAITTYNHPLDGSAHQDIPQASGAKAYEECVIFALLVGLVIMFTSYNFHALPAREGASGARHLHVMAGCPAALHWLCTLAFHTALTLATVVLITVICAYICDTDDTFRSARFLITLSLIMILGNIAFFGSMYLLFICFEGKVSSGVTIASILWGAITGLAKAFADITEEELKVSERIIFVLSNVFPSFSMVVGIAQAGFIARLNAICEAYKHQCPNMTVEDSSFDQDKCCAGESKAYISFGTLAPGGQMLIMLVQAIIFMTLVILIQMGYASCFYDRLSNKKFKPETPTHMDDLVAAEAALVDQEIELPEQEIVKRNKAMLIGRLHKNYAGFCRKQYAVKGISFSVKKGECFGLLGLNGAGKSSTFKMLTAETCPTSGRIFANGVFLHKKKKEFLRSIGYCPQFLGIDDFQTANNNLKTLLTIRGLDDNDIEKELKAWIAVVGLQKYANMKASSYSGGYKRRLATAASLCSGAPLSLLDEPTAGVDVGARRLVHNALRKALSLGDSIVITSHSMDEMEALCARIAILVEGKIRSMGTPAELRVNYAQGYALILKLKPFWEAPENSEGKGKSPVDILKNAVSSTFDCVLKDEHMTMLHYHIKDKMNYSDIFAILEELRHRFAKLIEDYSVSETTLEEVFLHLAKEHLIEKRAAEAAELEARKNKYKKGQSTSSSKQV